MKMNSRGLMKRSIQEVKKNNNILSDMAKKKELIIGGNPTKPLRITLS